MGSLVIPQDGYNASRVRCFDDNPEFLFASHFSVIGYGSELKAPDDVFD